MTSRRNYEISALAKELKGFGRRFILKIGVFHLMLIHVMPPLIEELQLLPLFSA